MTDQEFEESMKQLKLESLEKFVSEAMQAGFTKEQGEFLFNNCKNNGFMGFPMF